MPVRREQGRWFFRTWVRLPDGTKERVFGVPRSWQLPNTKAGAQEAERRSIQDLVTRRTGSAPRQEVPTVETFADLFVAISRADNKASSVQDKETILRLHIVPAMGSKRLDQVDYACVQDFKLSRLASGLSKKTVNNLLTVLRRMLVMAKKRDLIESVPEIEWFKLQRPKFDFLHFDEADKLIAAAQESWQRMITLAIHTGMRQGELLGLRWQDVDLVKGKLSVRQAIVRGMVDTPKNGKSREIPLSETAMDALKSQRHDLGEYAFCDSAGRVLTKGECKHPLWSTCKRAGLRRIGWHVLRHTFASHLAMRGAPLKVIQELMGHSTIQMTMRYAHLAPDVARDFVMLLDGGNSGQVLGRKTSQ